MKSMRSVKYWFHIFVILLLMVVAGSVSSVMADDNPWFKDIRGDLHMGSNSISLKTNVPLYLYHLQKNIYWTFKVPSGYSSSLFRIQTGDENPGMFAHLYLYDDHANRVMESFSFHGSSEKGACIAGKLTAGKTYYLLIYYGDSSNESYDTSLTINIDTIEPFPEIHMGENSIPICQAHTSIYTFVSEGPGAYTIQSNASGDDPDLRLYDLTGKLIARGEQKKGWDWWNETMTVDLQEDTTYYLHVIRNNGCSVPYEVVNLPLTIEGPRGISKADVVLGQTTYDYDGSVHKPSCTVTYKGTTLEAGKDYVVSYEDNINAGKGKVIVTGAGDYSGTKTLAFTINKAAQKITVKAVKATVSYSKLMKAKQVLAAKKVVSIKKAQGTVTYKKLSGNSKIIIAKKTGKVTLGKGLKKNTYKIKLRITASGGTNYKKISKDVTVKIQVK